MAVLGPNDPRALKRTGRSWKDRHGKVQPVLVDRKGREIKAVAGSVADLGRPDFIERLFESLEDAGGESLDDAVRHITEFNRSEEGHRQAQARLHDID